jgi:hypothetical protein
MFYRFGLIFLCSTSTVPTQDLHAQPPDVGWAICAVHTPCGVPAACSPRHRWSADDGLRRIDDTCGLVASGDPHVPPSVWGDHGELQDVALILGYRCAIQSLGTSVSIICIDCFKWFSKLRCLKFLWSLQIKRPRWWVTDQWKDYTVMNWKDYSDLSLKRLVWLVTENATMTWTEKTTLTCH